MASKTFPRHPRHAHDFRRRPHRELAACTSANSFKPVRWSSWVMLLTGLLLTCLLAAHLAERQRAELALKRSEERARLLFATIPHPPLSSMSRPCGFLKSTKQRSRKTGSRGEFERMKATDIRPAEEMERFSEHVHSSPANGCAGQWKHVSRDGRIIPVEVHYQISSTTTVTSSGSPSPRT